MKKLFICLCLLLLASQSSANAASFKLTVAEDAKYSTSSHIIINRPDLVAGNFAEMPPVYTMLKFNTADNPALSQSIAASGISSVTLNIFRLRTENSPVSNVFYLKNDSWTQGDWNTSHEAEFPYYDSSTILGTLPLVPANTSQQGWVSANLNIDKFLADSDGIHSLLIANSNFSMYLQGKDSIDQFINKDQWDGICASYLTIETNSAPVPEPSTMVLGIIGLGGLLGIRRKKI